MYIFAFFDGLGVASGALIGFFFPQIVSDIFGANFQTNDSQEVITAVKWLMENNYLLKIKNKT